MTLENCIAALIVALVLGGAIAYIVRARKKGVKCIGCPNGANCAGCSCSCNYRNEPEEERIN